MTDDQPRFARRRVRRDRPRQSGRPEYRSGGSQPGEVPADDTETDRTPTAQASHDRPWRDGPAPPVPVPPTLPRPSPSVDTHPVRQPRPAQRPRRDTDRGERGLRGLVGSGPSQVGVSGALRARDAARPTAADLRAAEAELVVVRRHYVPPDQFPQPAPSGPAVSRSGHSDGKASEDS